MTGVPSRLNPDAPLARKVTEAIKSGDAATLEQLLREHPDLATARLGDSRHGQSRTLLHVVTDWPGHVPEAAAKVSSLAAAGADVNARFTGPHGETPLHWAASSDDIEALDALLDAGAAIETDGAVIGGGTAMADAVAFGQWNAARRLLERGARTNLWQAAALGLVDGVRDQLADTPFAQKDLDNALWCAAHGGQHETAELLLDHGAHPAWVGHDGLTTAQAAERSNAHELAAWLRKQDTKSDRRTRHGRSGADIEELAGVRRHLLACSMPADRAGDHGPELGGDHGAVRSNASGCRIVECTMTEPLHSSTCAIPAQRMQRAMSWWACR